MGNGSSEPKESGVTLKDRAEAFILTLARDSQVREDTLKAVTIGTLFYLSFQINPSGIKIDSDAVTNAFVSILAPGIGYVFGYPLQAGLRSIRNSQKDRKARPADFYEDESLTGAVLIEAIKTGKEQTTTRTLKVNGSLAAVSPNNPALKHTAWARRVRNE